MSTNVPKQIQKLHSLRAEVARIERDLSVLTSLPAKFGFRSMDAFITALQHASGRSNSPTPPGVVKVAGRKPRAKITDATRAKVKKMAGEGKTGSEIAKALGISLPSVANIKKQLGLTRPRAKVKSPAAKTATKSAEAAKK